MVQHVTSSQIKSGFLVGRREVLEKKKESEEATGSKVGLPAGAVDQTFLY